MKKRLRQLITAIVLLNFSCKVTDKSVVGMYKSDQDAIIQTLNINPDHTFILVDFDYAKLLIKKQSIDSCHFITRGNWVLSEKNLILNSFGSAFIDTNRTRSIAKTSASSKESNFSFKDIYGDPISFDGVDDEKGNFRWTIHRKYTDLDVDLEKHKTLTFYLSSYRPWRFIVKDIPTANYIVTIAPIYKQGLLVNKSYAVKRNRIKDGKVKFKRDKYSKNVPSI